MLTTYWAKKLIFIKILFLVLSDSINLSCIESLPILFVQARTPHLVESPAVMDTDILSID